MPDETCLELELLLVRVRENDPAARKILLDRIHTRLRRLAGHILSRSFPALATRHDLDSVVHETWMRLATALESVTPESGEHLLRLMAHKVRQVLLDMVQRERRGAFLPLDGSTSNACPEPGGHSCDPARLAAWTEFHQRVESLEGHERTVFEMHYYLGLTQAETAATLGLAPRQVSRLWVTATERLADALGESLL